VPRTLLFKSELLRWITYLLHRIYNAYIRLKIVVILLRNFTILEITFLWWVTSQRQRVNVRFGVKQALYSMSTVVCFWNRRVTWHRRLHKAPFMRQSWCTYATHKCRLTGPTESCIILHRREKTRFQVTAMRISILPFQAALLRFARHPSRVRKCRVHAWLAFRHFEWLMCLSAMTGMLGL